MQTKNLEAPQKHSGLISFPSSAWERLLYETPFHISEAFRRFDFMSKKTSYISGGNVFNEADFEAELHMHAFPNGVWEQGNASGVHISLI